MSLSVLATWPSDMDFGIAIRCSRIRNPTQAAAIQSHDSGHMANSYHSLHPTAYPWVHQQWTKTFDHQA